MRRTHRPALLVLVTSVLLAACAGSADEAGGPDAAPPDGWQIHGFDGGSVATPTDWEVGDPLPDDALTVYGPRPPEGLPPVLRVKTTDRDPVPFDQLAGLMAASLALQVSGLEPAGTEEEIVLPGASDAMVVDFRYSTRVEDGDVEVLERVLLAWYGEQGQLQLRLGAPEAQLGELDDLVDDIIGSVRFDT